MSRQQEATPGDQAVSASVREEFSNVAKESFVAKDVHQDDLKVLYSCVDEEAEPYKRSHDDVIHCEIELPGKRKEIDAAEAKPAKTEQGQVTPDEDRISRPSCGSGETDETKSNVLEKAKGGAPVAEDTTAKPQDNQEAPIQPPVTAFGFNKDYVSPFSKLLESRTTNSFLEAKVAEDNPTTEDVGDDSDQLEPTEAAPKTWDLQAALGDGESLLYENKACSLSRYNDIEWSTPMPVVLQIIAKEESDEKRIVCYQAGTGRIQLNTTVLPTMSVNKLRTKSIIFVGQLIGDESKLAPHRLIFQDQIQRDDCHELF